LIESLDEEGNTATSPMQHLIIPQTFSELENFSEHNQQVKKRNEVINNQRERIRGLIKKLYQKFELAFQKWQEQQEQENEDLVEDNSLENNLDSGPKNPVSLYLFPENDSQTNENKDEKTETEVKNETKNPPPNSSLTDKDQNSSSPQVSQTDEIKSDTPLPEAQKLASQKVQQLLEKYSLKTEDLPLEYQNYPEIIQKLESTQAVIDFLSQMQKVIVQKTQNTSQQLDNFSSLPKDKNLPLFLLGLGMIAIGVGGLILFANYFFKKIDRN
jgi:hypothetical protein